MYSKSEYRDLLLKFKPYLKFASFCNDLDINKSNLYQFLKDDFHNECMSLENLDRLYEAIRNKYENFKL